MSVLMKKKEQEATMVENLISAGDKVEMKSVEPVILPDGTEGRKLYKSTVYDVLEDGSIEIMMPMEKTKLVLLPVEGEYEVCFFTNTGMYRGNVRIVDREKTENSYILITELITNLQKFQRREYFRFNCIIEMKTKEITENMAQSIEKKLGYLIPEIEMTRGVIVDLSGGGVRFVSRKAYSQDAVLFMKFTLEIGEHEREFELAAKVISCTEIPNRKNEYEIRTKFVYLDNTTREDIIKYIFNEERKNRKNGKGR